MISGTIQSIEIENWMPFRGKQVLKDIPACAIAVTAAHETNERRSNYSGKTALLEAIRWVFYNVHRKRYEDEVITEGESETSVKITLSDDLWFKRTRKLGKSSNLTVKVGDVTYKKKEAEEKIKEIIGFDYEDYRATVCFEQGDTLAIVGMKNAQRYKTVNEWMELDPWIRVNARAKAHYKQKIEQVKEQRFRIEKLSEDIQSINIEDTQKDIRDSESELNTARKNLAEVERKLEDVAALEILDQDIKRVGTLRDSIKDLRDRIKEAAIPSDFEKDVHDKQVNVEAKVSQANDELSKAKKHCLGQFDGTCPVTSKECPVADEIRNDKESAEARYKEARKHADSAKSELRQVEEELSKLNRKKSAFQRLRDSYNAKVSELKNLNESIEKQKQKYDRVEEFGDEYVEGLRQKKSELKQQEMQAISDLKDAEAEEKTYKFSKSEIERVEKSISDMERSVRIAHLAVKATSPSGIPLTIARSSLCELEQRANEILSDTGLSFEFGWERETKQLSSSCESCGYTYKGNRDKECPACSESRPHKRSQELEILVDDGMGQVEDVKAKSGAAKVLVASSIRLAASMMLRNRRGSQCTWAQVDEPFGALDAENREYLATAFAGLLNSVGLEQAFVVSHDAKLLDSLPARIEITRREDHSTLRLVK